MQAWAVLSVFAASVATIVLGLSWALHKVYPIRDAE